MAAAVALVVRAVVLAQLHDHPLLQPTGVLDSGVYVRLARRAAAGDWALGPDVYFVSPLYIYFLAVLFRLFGHWLLVPKLVQITLGALAIPLLGITARRLFGREPAALTAAGLAALTGAFAFHEVLLLQAAIDPFLTALALFALVRAATGKRLRSFALAGVAFGLLAANRPNALLAVAAVGLGLVAARRTRRSMAEALLLGLGLALSLAPFALRNRLVAGEWVLLSSHGGLNFYIGNNPEADGTYHGVPDISPTIEGQARDARKVAERALGRPLSTSEVSSYFYGQALTWIRSQPAAAATLMLRKVGYVLNAVDAPLNHSYAYYQREEATLLRVLLVGPWLLLPLGLLGLVVHHRAADRGAFFAWAAFVPTYALSVSVFFVSARYRLPLLVALCVSAGATVDRMVGWARVGRWRSLLTALAALGGFGGLVFLDLGLDDGRTKERAEMIVHLFTNRQDAAGKALLQSAEPKLLEKGLLYYRIGLTYLERGEPAPAASFFEQALGADPTVPDIRLSLGQALLAMGRAREAVPHLQAARDAGLSPADVGHDLARALAAAGRKSEALETIRGALAGGEIGAQAVLRLGLVAARLDAPEVALPAFRRAATLDPGLASARESLGLTLALLGRDLEAAPELEAACALDARSATARFNLALLRDRAGRPAEARNLVEEALRLRPGYPQALALRAQLDRQP